MGFVQVPKSGQLGAGSSPTGTPLAGKPGYFVSDSGGPLNPPLDDLESSYFGLGGSDVTSSAYAIVSDEPTEILSFDPIRMEAEIYCDDSSTGPIFIGGPQVAPVAGGNQPNAGIRLNPGSGRIYDGASRGKRVWAICAAGVTATCVVMLTPRSSQ